MGEQRQQSEEGRAQIVVTRSKAQIYERIFSVGFAIKGEGFGGVDLIGQSLGGVGKL